MKRFLLLLAIAFGLVVSDGYAMKRKRNEDPYNNEHSPKWRRGEDGARLRNQPVPNYSEQSDEEQSGEGADIEMNNDGNEQPVQIQDQSNQPQQVVQQPVPQQTQNLQPVMQPLQDCLTTSEEQQTQNGSNEIPSDAAVVDPNSQEGRGVLSRIFNNKHINNPFTKFGLGTLIFRVAGSFCKLLGVTNPTFYKVYLATGAGTGIAYIVYKTGVIKKLGQIKNIIPACKDKFFRKDDDRDENDDDDINFLLGFGLV